MAPERARWIHWLFRLAGRRASEAELGDLLEEYATGARGPLWLGRQVLSTIRRHDPAEGTFETRSSAAALDLLRDIRHGARMLVKSPGFTLLAIATFALGIGVNVTMFSVVNSALFKPFYGERPRELVEVYAGDADRRTGFSSHAYIDYVDFRNGAGDVVSGLTAFYTEPGYLAVGPATERINVGLISDNYFHVFGITPLVGRGFSRGENTTPAAHHVAVIGEGLWRRQFGGTRDLGGAAVSLNGSSYTVVGVVPEPATRMFGLAKIDVFVPAMMQGPIRGGRDWLSARGNHEFLVVGRLRPGVTLARARATFAAIGDRLSNDHPDAWRSPDGRGRGLTVVPATPLTFELRGYAVGAAGLLMIAVGSVLLIACSNLAGFLLARTFARRKEIATRVALGAGRWRVVRLLLTENLLVAAIGGVTGLLVAIWTTDLLRTFTPNLGVPLAIDLSLDYRVLAFSIVAILAATAASGLPAALHGTRPSGGTGNDALREAAPSSTPGRRHARLRDWLIVGQVAVSLALVMCGGTFIGSLSRLQQVNVGFDPVNLALLSVNLGTQGYSDQRARAFLDAAVARAGRLPGVESVSLAARVPMALSRVRQELRPPAGVEDGVDQGTAYVAFNRVDGNYFDTMRIPLLAGRTFQPGDGDGDGRASTAIVNDAFAEWFWKRDNPIGKVIVDAGGSSHRVVGVVRASTYDSLGERRQPFVYYPVGAAPRSEVTLHVRTRSAPAPILETLRRELLALDPAVAVFDVRTMSDHLAGSLLPVRIGATLLGIFGTLALALASIGLYGVMAHAVAQRKKELGIRLALGARPSQARNLVLRFGLSLAMRGLAIGAAIGAGLSAMIASEFYGGTPIDLSTLVLVVAMQSGVAVLACWLPAQRATRVDPMTSLRYD